MRLSLRRPVDAPPERVWQVLADWERYAEWMPDVAWVRPAGLERDLGMRLAVRTRVFGLPLVTDSLLVTAWEPPRRMAIVHQGLVRGTAEWLVEPSESGSTFTWTEELAMPAALLGELGLWAYRPILLWTFRRSMRNLASRAASGS